MRIHLIAGARPHEAVRRAVHLSFLGHGVASLTLPGLAALLPRHHEVRLQDEQVAPLDLRAPMDLALLTAKTCYAPRVYEIAQQLRARGVPVVMGGCHASLNPDEAGQHVDAVVRFEADAILGRVLQDVEARRLQPRYEGGPVDLRRVPRPRRDLLQKRYLIHAVQVSRGCRHACGFCCIRQVYGPGCRTRPLSDVVDELRSLGPLLGFLDENLVADPDFAEALFRAMIPLRKRWMAQVSVDVLDRPELLELAGRAGATGFFFGIESLDPRNLAAAGKSQNDVRRYGDLVRACHAAGIAVGAGMLFGLDQDRPDVFDRTLAGLEDLGVDQGYFKIATPYPGTPFFASLDAEGRILSRDWSRYDGCFPVFRPRFLTPRQLFEGVRSVRTRFYRRRSVLRRLDPRLRLPAWAQLNMARLAAVAYRQADLDGERYLREIDP